MAGVLSGRQFSRDTILFAVRRSLPLRAQLSRSRGNDARARGSSRAHHHLPVGPELDKQTGWRWQVSDWQARSWPVYETYIRFGDKWCYLYRAITAGGCTLDFYLSPKRNVTAAKRFLSKTLRLNAPAEYPRVIRTDKAPALAKAISELKTEEVCPPTGV